MVVLRASGTVFVQPYHGKVFVLKGVASQILQNAVILADNARIVSPSAFITERQRFLKKTHIVALS